MQFNRQKFSFVVGLFVVGAHITMSAYLWLLFQPQVDKVVAIAQISMPLTVSYSLTVVTWFIANNGIPTSDAKVGLPLVILTVMVVGSFLGALPVGPYLYSINAITPEGLNQYYTFVESALGGMFVLIFNFLFERDVPTSSNVSPPAPNQPANLPGGGANNSPVL